MAGYLIGISVWGKQNLRMWWAGGMWWAVPTLPKLPKLFGANKI
jgi:hypothetical protein